MSVQMVLLPVFVLVGLTFALLLGMATARGRALKGREPSSRDIALGQPNWPTHATQIGNCFANQFELPVLFYILIALALPLRHADLVIVLLAWVFVITRFVHAGIFVTSNNVEQVVAGVVRGRIGAVCDVAVLRAEGTAADLSQVSSNRYVSSNCQLFSNWKF
jgi:hypothetical protein